MTLLSFKLIPNRMPAKLNDYEAIYTKVKSEIPYNLDLIDLK